MHRLLCLILLTTSSIQAESTAAAVQPGVSIPDRFAADHASGDPEAALAAWWTTFGDATLNTLIDDALQGNRDLVVAEARVAEAVARRRAAAGELWPQLGVEGRAVRIKPSESSQSGSFSGGDASNDFTSTLTASWELDVFGRIRQGVQAAQARAEADEEARRDVLVLLLAEVASTYLELRGLQNEQAVVMDNIKSQQESVDLTRVRRDAGVDNALAVAQAEGQLATTKATLPPLTQGIREAQHRLATLTGQPPATYLQSLSAAAPWPTSPGQVPAGLPSSLLARRPDVRRAERLVAAATAQVGQARAARLPSFALTAQTGRQSQEIGDLVERRASLWSLGASMSIPLFTGGTLKQNVKAAEAALHQARAGYEQTMLLSLEEVETALVRHTESQNSLTALREAETQARTTLTLSTDLYKNGAGSFLNVLDAQRSKLYAQAQAVSAQRQVAISLVGLYKALGGGWEVVAGPSQVPAHKKKYPAKTSAARTPTPAHNTPQAGNQPLQNKKTKRSAPTP